MDANGALFIERMIDIGNNESIIKAIVKSLKRQLIEFEGVFRKPKFGVD